MTAREAVVAGAGVSGLCSALILARRGFRVTLLEPRDRVGMTLRGFTRRGVYFDTGLHYTGGLGENGALTRLFARLGINLQTEPFADDGFDLIHLVNSGRAVPIRNGAREFSEGLKKHFPAETKAIEDFTADLVVAHDSSEYLAASPSHDLAEKALALDTISLAQRLAAISDPDLRQVLSCHTLLHGTPPSAVSMLLHGRILGSYLHGAHSVRGGGKALVRALEKACLAAGVAIRLKTRLCRVECADKRVQGARLESGERLPASLVLYTGRPEAVPDLFEPGTLRPKYAARMRGLAPTPSACMLFGTARTIPPILAGRNLFYLDSAGPDAAFRADAQPERGPFFVTATPDPAGGPGGGVTVIAPAGVAGFEPYTAYAPGKRPAAYYDLKKRVLAGMERRIRELCPDLAGVDCIDGATPATLAHYLDNPGGALYGIRRPYDGFAPMPLTRVAGFAVAGQGVVAPGVLGAVISAFVACDLITGAHQEDMA